MTVESLLAAAEYAQTYTKDVLGYDQVCFNSIRISPCGEIVYSFDLIDEFQRYLPEEVRDRSGYYQEINHPLLENLQKWPNREMRELGVMAKKLSLLGQQTDELKSELARSFNARFAADLASLQNLITNS